MPANPLATIDRYTMEYGDKVGKIKAIKSKMVWREQSGLLTPIAQMSDHHLMCAIRMVQESIREQKFWRSAYLPYLKEERAYRRALTIRNSVHQRLTGKEKIKCPPR